MRRAIFLVPLVWAIATAPRPAAALSVFAPIPTPTEAPLCLIYESEGWVHVGRGKAIPETAEVHYNVREEVPHHCVIRYHVYDPTGVATKDGHLAVMKREGFVFEANTRGLYKVCFSMICPTGLFFAGLFGNSRQVEAGADTEIKSKRVTLDVSVDGANTPNSGMDKMYSPDVDRKNLTIEAAFSAFDDGMKLSVAEVEYLMVRQRRFDATVQSTHWRVMVMTFVNAAVALASVLWQIRSLKALFREKKAV